MFGRYLLRSMVAAAVLMGWAAAVDAQDTVKVGVIAPMTGNFQTTGKQINAAIKAFVPARGDQAGGKKIEIILRDDGGVADTSLRIAQEMVTTDNVSILTGFGTTPNALSVATLSKRAKVPQVIMVAATSAIMKASPYILRTSQTIPQIASVIGEWAPANNAKKFVTVVSDYGPGIDAEEWFSKTLQQKGGEVIEKVRVPVVNPDFAPFLQRVADKKPEALFVFVPSGIGAAFMKQFVERGLDKSGIRLIAMSDVTDDDLLNSIGDPALGLITGGPYSANHNSPENKTFVEQFKTVNNGMRPNIVAVSAWDALDLIYKTLDKTKGDPSGDAFVAAAKGTRLASARGPVMIDAESGDIVQTIYMRKVERIDGELYNNEFTAYEAVKDPAR